MPETGKRFSTIILTTVVCSAVAACTARRHFEADDAPLPESFSLPCEPSCTPLPDQWWHHFDDPRLNDVIQSALDGSFTLAAARSRLKRAYATADVEGASLFPSFDISGGASERRSDSITRENYSVSAAATYEVDLWGRIDSEVKASKLEADATEEDLQAAAITLTADTATTFYSLLQQRAVIDLLEQQQRVNRQIADLIAVRYRNAQAELDELLRQQRLVESSRSSLQSARAERESLKNSLAALLGRSRSDIHIPDGHDLVTIPDLPKIGLPAVWLNRRPDLKGAWLRVRSADEDLAAAIAARYPRLDLSATWDTSGENTGALFDDWIRTLAADLTVPLFRGGELEAEVDRNRASRSVAFNEYAQSVEDAIADVETVLSDSRFDRRRLTSLNRQVKLANRALNQLRRRYLNGATPYIDVLNALTSLQDVKRERLDARWALVFDRITLVRSIAGGWLTPERNTTAEES